MKSVLLALAAATTLAVPTAAHAETWAQQATRAKSQGYQPAIAPTDACAAMEGFARKVLEARYAGVSMSAMITVANNSDSPEAGKVMRLIIIDAFEQPAFSTDAYQSKAIDDFAGEWALSCYKSVIK